MQLLITFLVLFYFLRDRDQSLALLRSLSPLTERETARVFKRVSETIRGTVFGTLVVAAVQGILGGAMFWLLGLPAPILWGGGDGDPFYCSRAWGLCDLVAASTLSRAWR
jgi:predicted PurR-regulated permease PerM